jgi:nitrite reductase/ring-hydroxylating ferredoxin subunit/uncharacterized membrane protein
VRRARSSPGPLYAGNELHAAAVRLEETTALDRPAATLQHAAHRALPEGVAKDLLSGTWLGHPLHPMLTDLPIGFWTSAWVLDVLGPRRYHDAARVLVGLGVLSALPAAASGVSDWSDTGGGSRRVGLVHAAANAAAATLYVGSWWARRRGHVARGVALGMAGAAAATVGGYLGGHLVQGRGVGVDPNRDAAAPEAWTRVLDADEAGPEPRGAEAGGLRVAVFRHAGRPHALAATCPHRAGPLDEGTIVDDCIECPWHGSRFRVDDGALVRGPAAAPIVALDAREADSAIEVRRRST